MNYLLYSSQTSVTGKLLLDSLIAKGISIHGGTRGPGDVKLDTLIRWGAPDKIARRPVKVLNRADAIISASNKSQALNTMKEAGVHTPKVVVNPLSPTPNEDVTFPLLGRREHHVGGNDIVLCLQRKDVERARQSGCTYFTKYVPTKAEYRVHVFGDQIIKVSQKILTDAEAATQPWVRNLEAGYTFRQPELRLSGSARGMALDAVNSLGLTFGAVDLIVGDDDQVYVLEVNTAPGLTTDSSVEAYLEQFINHLK